MAQVQVRASNDPRAARARVALLGGTIEPRSPRRDATLRGAASPRGNSATSPGRARSTIDTQCGILFVDDAVPTFDASSTRSSSRDGRRLDARRCGGSRRRATTAASACCRSRRTPGRRRRCGAACCRRWRAAAARSSASGTATSRRRCRRSSSWRRCCATSRRSTWSSARARAARPADRALAQAPLPRPRLRDAHVARARPADLRHAVRRQALPRVGAAPPGARPPVPHAVGLRRRDDRAVRRAARRRRARRRRPSGSALAGCIFEYPLHQWRDVARARRSWPTSCGWRSACCASVSCYFLHEWPSGRRPSASSPPPPSPSSRSSCSRRSRSSRSPRSSASAGRRQVR